MIRFGNKPAPHDIIKDGIISLGPHGKGPADFFNYDFKPNTFYFKLLAPFVQRILIEGMWRVRLEGLENIPTDSNFMLMPNHISHLDAPFAVAPLYRRGVSCPLFIADEKLFKNKVFRKYVAKCFNVFPVRKGTKSTAIVDYGISRVNKGYNMLWFIEGMRHKSPEVNSMNPPKLGSGMIAHAVDAPIIPVFIAGAEHAMPVGRSVTWGRGPRTIKVLVRYGKPVELDDLRKLEPSKETSEKVAKRIWDAIEVLRPTGPYHDQSPWLHRNRK